MTDITTNEPPAQKPGLIRSLRNYFLTGTIVAAPIIITAYLAWSVITTIDHWVDLLIPPRYNPEAYFGFAFPGLGVLIALVSLTLLGALTANFFGRFLIRTGERLLDRMPVIRSVYSTLKQVFETVMSTNSTSFQNVVLLEYPRLGIWTIGFVSGPNKGEVQKRVGGEIVNVFVPTTPNPTSGFLLFVPQGDLIYLDMSIDEGLKYVISAGLVTPQELAQKAKVAKTPKI
jgi:uncharacterized membrane protein